MRRIRIGEDWHGWLAPAGSLAPDPTPPCLPARLLSCPPQTLGYAQPNMRFVEGEIEYLDKAGIPDSSVDLIISNCVVGSLAWCGEEERMGVAAARLEDGRQ